MNTSMQEEEHLKWFEHRQPHDSVTKRPYIKGYDRPPGPGPHSYEIQFIGYTRYVKPEEEQRRNFCGSFFCTNDAFYIFTKSSQYLGLDVCHDFKNFSVDHVVQVDVPDDRDQRRGFSTIVDKIYDERLRKVAATSKVIRFSRNETNRVFRVVRNHFAQCLRSSLVLRHLQAHQDTVEHLESLGGSPHLYKHRNFNKQLFNHDPREDYGRTAIQTRTLRFDFDAMDDEWNSGGDFNVSRLFEAEVAFSLNLFLDLEVTRCDGEVLCLREPLDSWGYNENAEYEFKQYKQLLDDLEDFFLGLRPFGKILDEEYYRPAINRKREFLKRRDELKRKHKGGQTAKMRIKELQSLMPVEFEVSWLKLINGELLKKSRVGEDEEILIKGGVARLKALIGNVIDTDMKIVADAFVLSFLYWHRTQIILRFHNKHHLNRYGYKKGWQRWYTCLRQFSIVDFMYPALIVMYEEQRNIWDRTLGDLDRNVADNRLDVLGSAEQLVREAIEEFKRRFIKRPNLPPNIALDVLRKLKQIQIVTSLRSDVFPPELLEEFYRELPLNGDENFMQSTWEMRRHHRRVVNEPRQSWRRQIDRTVYAQGHELITYNIEDGNILYIPPSKLIYPLYHPSRPRFFNMATLYADVIAQLHSGVEIYIGKIHNRAWDSWCCSDNAQIAYEAYRDWLKSNTELQIGANYLTNQQLYWLAFALSRYSKFHRTVPSTFNAVKRLQHEYLHVLYKDFEGFQEAFNCSLTKNEKEELEEFKRKWEKISG